MNLFCRHKWKEKERYQVTREYLDGRSIPDCSLIIQECEKCGKLKKRSFP